MTFELSPEHEQFRRSVRDFAEKEIAPHAAQWDREHHFPTDVVQKMGKLGLMGLTAPEEFGGAGMAGEDGSPEISAIVIPSGTPGFTVEKPYEKLGWHASDTHPLSFENCRVPESNLLGKRGRGYAQFLSVLDDGRVAIAALAVGCIQACLDMSLQYAGERQTFGVPIGRKQGVAFQLADLEVMLQASRVLTYQAAAVAKLYATESAVTATRIATQVFGGYGFMEEYPVVRFYRDAKVLEIGEGTSEVQRMLIARGLGLPVE